MEKIYKLDSFHLLSAEEFVFSTIIEYLDVQTLIARLAWTNAGIHKQIMDENYILLNKLRDFLNIPTTFDCSSLPAEMDMVDLFKNWLKAMKKKPEAISPFAYYTDGGVDTNGNYYFLQNVWKKTNICYWTISHKNVHVQSIITKKIKLPNEENTPEKWYEDGGYKLKIRVPYEKYIKEDADNFQLLKTFQVHLNSGGYNAYIRTFAVFYSESEVDNTKFQVMTRRFHKAKAEADLQCLKLDIHHKEEDKKSGIKIIEFSVASKKKIERWLRLKNPPFYPLLWIRIRQKYWKSTINYKIRQRVAAKYISLKLLTSSNDSPSANIDLYNLGLKGVSLNLTDSAFES